MSVDVINSLHTRCASLEDIIRQQEQVINAVLNRLRDVEQAVSSDSRSLENNQQQLNSLLNERSGTAAQIDHLNHAIGNQNERISNVEAGHQGLVSAVQGVDQKYDATSRALENRLQGDVQAIQQRLQASEQSTAEAIRAVQSGVQGNANSIQTVDSNTRASLESLQQQLASEVANVRQRVDQLESGMRQALQDMHGSISDDIRGASQQMEALLQTAIQNQNESLLALDQRVRGEMTQLNTQEQNDVAELRRRLEENNNQAREAVQSLQVLLTANIDGVSAFARELESRQRAAHQDLIQELSKHDQQMETIDVNWRASVLDLSGKVENDNRTLQQQFQAGDLNIQYQLNGLQDRFVAVSEQINRNLNDLATNVQERCIVPLEVTNGAVTRHGERITKLAEDSDAVREFLRVFSQEIDKNSQQMREATDGAIRASHTDLLERINLVSTATALHADPDQVYAQINDALTRIWGDVSNTFTTQKDLNGIQSQIATLESAIRAELFSLLQKNNDLNARVKFIMERPENETPARSATGGLSSSNNSEVSRSENVSRVEQISIVRESEEELEKVRSTAKDVVNYAKAAEDAQDRCVAAVNESRAILNSVSSIQNWIAEIKETMMRQKNEVDLVCDEQRRQKAELETMIAAQKTADQVVPTAERASSSKRQKSLSGQPPLVPAALIPAAAAPPSASEEEKDALVSPFASKQEGRRGSSADEVRRISGTFNGTDFMVRDSTPSSGRPSLTVANVENGNEVLLPTHQFVRKKEFSNYKEYTKKEIDNIWKELLEVKNRGGAFTREEALLISAQTKEEVVKSTAKILKGQEVEFHRLIDLIREQLRQAYILIGMSNDDAQRAVSNVVSGRAPNAPNAGELRSPRVVTDEYGKINHGVDKKPNQNRRVSKPIALPDTPRSLIVSGDFISPESVDSSVPLSVELYRPQNSPKRGSGQEDELYFAEVDEPSVENTPRPGLIQKPSKKSSVLQQVVNSQSGFIDGEEASPELLPLYSSDSASPRFPAVVDVVRGPKKSLVPVSESGSPMYGKQLSESPSQSVSVDRERTKSLTPGSEHMSPIYGHAIHESPSHDYDVKRANRKSLRPESGEERVLPGKTLEESPPRSAKKEKARANSLAPPSDSASPMYGQEMHESPSHEYDVKRDNRKSLRPESSEERVVPEKVMAESPPHSANYEKARTKSLVPPSDSASPIYGKALQEPPFHEYNVIREPEARPSIANSEYDPSSPHELVAHMRESPTSERDEEDENDEVDEQKKTAPPMIDFSEQFSPRSSIYTELEHSPKFSSDEDNEDEDQQMNNQQPNVNGMGYMPENGNLNVPDQMYNGNLNNNPFQMLPPNWEMGYNPFALPNQGLMPVYPNVPQQPYAPVQQPYAPSGPISIPVTTRGEYRFTPSANAHTKAETTANLLAQVDMLERQLMALNTRPVFSAPPGLERDPTKDFMMPLREGKKNPVARDHHLTPLSHPKPKSERKHTPERRRSAGGDNKKENSHHGIHSSRAEPRRHHYDERDDEDDHPEQRRQRKNSHSSRGHPNSRSTSGNKRKVSPASDQRRLSASRRHSSPGNDEREPMLETAPPAKTSPFNPSETQPPSQSPVIHLYSRPSSGVDRTGMTSTPSPEDHVPPHHKSLTGNQTPPVRVLDNSSNTTSNSTNPSSAGVIKIAAGHAYEVPSTSPNAIRIRPSSF